MSGKRRLDKVKTKHFAQLYLQNDMDAFKAMKEMSKPDASYHYLKTKTWRWMHNQDVLDAIYTEMKESGITPEKVKEIIRWRMLKTVTSEQSKDSDATGASLMLAKIDKLIAENDNKQVNVSVFADQLNQLKPVIDVKRMTEDSQVMPQQLDITVKEPLKPESEGSKSL